MLYNSQDRTHSTKGSYVMVVARVLGGTLLGARAEALPSQKWRQPGLAGRSSPLQHSDPLHQLRATRQESCEEW